MFQSVFRSSKLTPKATQQQPAELSAYGHLRQSSIAFHFVSGCSRVLLCSCGQALLRWGATFEFIRGHNLYRHETQDIYL